MSQRIRAGAKGGIRSRHGAHDTPILIDMKESNICSVICREELRKVSALPKTKIDMNGKLDLEKELPVLTLNYHSEVWGVNDEPNVYLWDPSSSSSFGGDFNAQTQVRTTRAL